MQNVPDLHGYALSSGRETSLLTVSFYWSSKRSTYNIQVNGKGFPIRKSLTGVIWKATVSAESKYLHYKGTLDIFTTAQSIEKANGWNPY
eukprot:14555487-Ditylum_brightwellii.AAC.2